MLDTGTLQENTILMQHPILDTGILKGKYRASHAIIDTGTPKMSFFVVALVVGTCIDVGFGGLGGGGENVGAPLCHRGINPSTTQ